MGQSSFLIKNPLKLERVFSCPIRTRTLNRITSYNVCYTKLLRWLAEIFRHDEFDYMPAMSYVSVTKPGVARGPHEHVYQSDCFVFVGPGSFDLYLWDRRGNSGTKGEHIKMNVGEDNPVMVIVPPGVA